MSAEQPKEQKYSEDELRDDVKKLQDDGMSFAAQAKEAGIKYGSFTNWVGGTYAGDTQRIAAQVSQWLAARAERKLVSDRVRAAPDFVETPTARDIIAQLTYVQATPDIMVVVGVPGIGKTKAAEQYQKTNPNVFMFTALSSMKTAFGMLEELAFTVDVNERRATRINRAIGMKLKGRKSLIIVDEAQHLTGDALDELRAFHDLWDCGIAMIGDMRLHTRIHGKGRDGNLAQLSSRVGMRIKQLRPRTEDIAMIASAWGILDPKVMRLVQKIGLRDGGLRILTKTLKLASISAAGGGDDPLSEAAIGAAFAQLEHSVAV
jgi:DNA transposition AAA+ family ATPase